MFLKAWPKLLVLIDASPPVISAMSCNDSVELLSAACVTVYGVERSISADMLSLAAPRPPAWMAYMVRLLALAVLAMSWIFEAASNDIPSSSVDPDCHPFSRATP